MRSAFFVFAFAASLLLFDISFAQDSNAEARKRLMERRTGGNTGSFVTPSSPTTTRTIVTYITYLSPEREWTDAKGRTMTGRLVAFSAPKPGETGEVIVMKDGKVRLRRKDANSNSDLLLTQLSEADQLFVKAVDAGIRRSAATAKTKEE